MFWTLHRIALLRQLAAKRWSGSMIAAHPDFNCTRSTVLGKAWRMGISLAGPDKINHPWRVKCVQTSRIFMSVGSAAIYAGVCGNSVRDHIKRNGTSCGPRRLTFRKVTP